MARDAIAVILGGGQGSRLYPLTKYRAKPAVPIAGKFRLIDIPISNCIHSELKRIFVVTQFNSTSLNRHIVQTYRFDVFSRGYVQILAAQQTLENMDWYQGTADAVRHNLRRLIETPCDCVVILAGDHLYRMDYRDMIHEHEEKKSDITVGVVPVHKDKVREFGILKTDLEGRVTEFMEKPQEDSEIQTMAIDESAFQQRGIQPLGRSHVASMGIYVFSKDILVDCLQDKSMLDFGRHVVPASIHSRRVYAYYFNGYWRDVGTIKSFYDTNLELTRVVPEFDFYNESALVYTHPRFLPGSKINSCNIQSSILCEGTIISGSEIQSSIIGIRSIIRSGAQIRNSVLMGADYYESFEDQEAKMKQGLPPIGIGEGSIIQNAIVDQNARIGRNVRIVNSQGYDVYDDASFSIRDGIVVVHRNSAIADNAVI